MPPSGVDVAMAFAQWTLLLAVLLVGPVAAISPLDPVDVEQIVTNLGSYFEELADNTLSVDTANVSLSTHARKCVLNRVKARGQACPWQGRVVLHPCRAYVCFGLPKSSYSTTEGLGSSP